LWMNPAAAASSTTSSSSSGLSEEEEAELLKNSITVFHSDDGTRQIRHYVFACENSEAGILWNAKSLHILRQHIESLSIPQKSFNILNDITVKGSVLLSQFFETQRAIFKTVVTTKSTATAATAASSSTTASNSGENSQQQQQNKFNQLPDVQSSEEGSTASSSTTTFESVTNYFKTLFGNQVVQNQHQQVITALYDEPEFELVYNNNTQMIKLKTTQNVKYSPTLKFKEHGIIEYGSAISNYFRPLIDILQLGSELIVVAEIPGVEERNLQWRIIEGIKLELHGIKTFHIKDPHARLLTRQNLYGAFNHTVILPFTVANAKHTMNNGVLTITAQKL